MKKDKKFIIIIILLSVLLAGSIGFICYDKFITNESDNDIEVKDNNKKDDEKIEDVIERDLTYDELSVLKSKIDVYNDGFSSYYPISDMSKIENNDLFLFAVGEMRRNNNQVFDGNLMTAYLKEFFGDEVKLEHKDFNCLADNKLLYKYDSETNTYTFVPEGHWHGGSQRAYLPDISTKILDSNYKDGIYTINTKVLYSNTCSDTCGPVSSYFKSFSDSLSNTNPVATRVSEYIIEEEKDAYRTNLPITTYKFKKNDTGNMILVSVEVK